jgi:hypothetical protein
MNKRLIKLIIAIIFILTVIFSLPTIFITTVFVMGDKEALTYHYYGKWDTNSEAVWLQDLSRLSRVLEENGWKVKVNYNEARGDNYSAIEKATERYDKNSNRKIYTIKADKSSRWGLGVIIPSQKQVLTVVINDDPYYEGGDNYTFSYTIWSKCKEEKNVRYDLLKELTQIIQDEYKVNVLTSEPYYGDCYID